MVEGARLESVYTATYRGFESLLLRQNQKKGLLGPFFSFDGGWCGRTLWFDKLCLRQSLDAKPIGGAPCKGESGEGNAARIYPSFSASEKKD